MEKIEINLENDMAIFTDNITCNNKLYYIIPKNISCVLDDIYINDFLGIEKEKNFIKKCSAFFSYFFFDCEQWSKLSYKRRISYKVLRSFFCNTRNKTYIDYVKAFIEYGLFRKSSNHSDKLNLCNEYQLIDNLVDGNYTLYVFENKKNENYQVQNEVVELDMRFLETLSILKVNLNDSIKNEFDSYFQYNDPARFFKRINKIFYFNNTKTRNIHYGTKVKRIYHPICFLTKESRSCLNIKFYNLDIVNCQPLLLCYHLKNQDLGIDDEFIHDVQKGQFYENIQKQLESLYIIKSRDEVKKGVYSEILFSFKSKKKHIYNSVFKDLYPLTHISLDYIYTNSKKTNVTLASILQNLESDLFNNLKVKKSEYYFTLFDAIYFDDKTDEENLKSQIFEYFNELDLRVSISDK